MANLLKKLQVTPPSAGAELSLSLTFFDMIWLHYLPIRILLFYEFPCSREDFLSTIVQRLVESLSITLKHYLPFAGKIIYPLDGESKPTIRYLPGDSVSLTIFESDKDFDNLVGHHARDADEFYDFIPMLPPVTEESDHKLLQVLALQVTLLPDRGICIGVATHHSMTDANSLTLFIRSWAAISKLEGDDQLSGESLLPLIDRSLVQDPRGIDSLFWKANREIPFQTVPFPLPTNRVRATFIFTPSDLEKLKDLVRGRVVHTSSFVVMAAYVWSCLAKTRDAAFADDDPEFFIFTADARSRINPPLPENYFGNCLSYALVEVRHGDLAGGEGFFAAAEAIADRIKNKINNKDEMLKDFENQIPELFSVTVNPYLGVAGSARVDIYGTDFGWGSVRKVETLHPDGEEHSMSLWRGPDGGLEVGMSLTKEKMEAFTGHFADGKKMMRGRADCDTIGVFCNLRYN